MNIMCNALPYMGEDPYVFVHFSKRDENEAYTLIEMLACKGYRIWYAGEQKNILQFGEDKAALISKKIEGCCGMIALYSPDAADDHQFRKIITAAVLNQKKIIPVILNSVQLSMGMRIQLGNEEWINWNSELDNCEQLISRKMMQKVQGMPDPGIRVIRREKLLYREKGTSDEKNAWPISMILEDEEAILRQKGFDGKRPEYCDRQNDVSNEQNQLETDGRLTDRQLKNKKETNSSKEEHVQDFIKQHDVLHGGFKKNENHTQIEDSLEYTMLENRTEYDEQQMHVGRRGRNGTMIIEEIDPICVVLSSGIYYKGCYGLTRIGRNSDNHICIPDNTVSSLHLEVMSVADTEGIYKNTIKDNHSSNGTWVDGKRLQGGEIIKTGDSASVCLSKRIHLHLAFSHRAEKLLKEKKLAYLECCEIRGMHAIDEDDVVLGRNDPWSNGFFEDSRISWEHALIQKTENDYRIIDQSSNGTYINGERMKKNEAVIIHDGDEIGMGHRKFLFHLIELKENTF